MGTREPVLQADQLEVRGTKKTNTLHVKEHMEFTHSGALGIYTSLTANKTPASGAVLEDELISSFLPAVLSTAAQIPTRRMDR